MFPAENAEQFKNRVEKGLTKTTTYHNYYASLQPSNRYAIGVKSPIKVVKVKKTVKSRLQILRELL